MDTTRNQNRLLGFLIAGAITGMLGGVMMAMFTMLATGHVPAHGLLYAAVRHRIAARRAAVDDDRHAWRRVLLRPGPGDPGAGHPHAVVGPLGHCLWPGRGPLARAEAAGFHRPSGRACPPGSVARACPLSRPGIPPERERGAAALPVHAALPQIYTTRKGASPLQ